MSRARWTTQGRAVGARGAWRQGAAVLGVLVLAGSVAGCTAGAVDDDVTATPTSAATSEPTASQEPEPAPEPEESETAQVPTDISANVLLPDGSFGLTNGGTSAASTTEWQMPQDCGDLALPASATAHDGLMYGDGSQESVVGLHQVVVMADAQAAVEVADEVAAAFAGCAAPAENPGAYVVQDVAVGAQGKGLAWSYYRTGEVRDDDIGTYMVVTRRGNAVSLVGTLSGETAVATARAEVTGLAQKSWELLCRYDSKGC